MVEVNFGISSMVVVVGCYPTPFEGWRCGGTPQRPSLMANRILATGQISVKKSENIGIGLKKDISRSLYHKQENILIAGLY